MLCPGQGVDGMKGNVNAAASFALVAAVLAACGSAYAGPLPTEAIPPASGELTTLADLVVMLKRELQAVEQRLVAECDAVEARDHFVDVRNRALTAVNRLGSLWQTGRLRSGTLAASEGLTRDLVVLIYEAQDAAVLAHALALLQDEARRMSDGRGGGSEGRRPRCSIQPFASSDRADPPATERRLQIDLNDGESAGENR